MNIQCQAWPWESIANKSPKLAKIFFKDHEDVEGQAQILLLRTKAFSQPKVSKLPIALYSNSEPCTMFLIKLIEHECPFPVPLCQRQPAVSLDGTVLSRNRIYVWSLKTNQGSTTSKVSCFYETVLILHAMGRERLQSERVLWRHAPHPSPPFSKKSCFCINFCCSDTWKGYLHIRSWLVTKQGPVHFW